jgi:hypothetical protein
MNIETKLRIHNITAKASLKFGSEAWVLKKRGTTFRSRTDILETHPQLIFIVASPK